MRHKGTSSGDCKVLYLDKGLDYIYTLVKTKKVHSKFLHFSCMYIKTERQTKIELLLICFLKYLGGSVLMSAIYFEVHIIIRWITGCIERWIDT